MYLPTFVLFLLSNERIFKGSVRRCLESPETGADVSPGPRKDTVAFTIQPSLPFLLETSSPTVLGDSPPSCSAQGVRGADKPPKPHQPRLRDRPVTQA